MIWEAFNLIKLAAPQIAVAMPMLVRDLLALYLRHSKANGLHCAQALAEREQLFKLFLIDHGDTAVEDCKPFHLSDWIDAHEDWRSVATRRAKANMIRAAFEWATEQERIPKNPFKKVRYAEAERRPCLPDECLATIQHLANKKFELALRFLRLTGCRLSELAEAAWADIDFDKAIWIIRRHKSRRYTHRDKVVALVPEAIQLLIHMAWAIAPVSDAAAMKTFLASQADSIIFLNNRGTPWNRRTLGQTLARIKKKYGIKTRASLHGIRHNGATEAIANGASMELIAEQYGHSSPAVTAKYYWHPNANHTSAIRDAFERGLQKDA